MEKMKKSRQNQERGGSRILEEEAQEPTTPKRPVFLVVAEDYRRGQSIAGIEERKRIV